MLQLKKGDLGRRVSTPQQAVSHKEKSKTDSSEHTQSPKPNRGKAHEYTWNVQALESDQEKTLRVSSDPTLSGAVAAKQLLEASEGDYAQGQSKSSKSADLAEKLAKRLSPKELQVFVQEAERKLKNANYTDKFREKALYPVRARLIAQVPSTAETGTQAAQSLLELSELQYHMGESKTYKSAEFARHLAAQLLSTGASGLCAGG